MYKPDGGTVDLRDYGLGGLEVEDVDGPTIPIHGSLN